MNVTGSILTATAPSHQAPHTRAAGGSGAEGPPVTHNRHEPIGFDAAQRRDNGTARYAVLSGQLCHRWQSLLWLPFALVDSRTQGGLNALTWQFGRAVRWHSAMIANTV